MRVESYILQLMFILLLARNVFCQTFSIEGGANHFLGGLQKEIKIAPYFGTGLEIELSDYTAGYLQGSYSYLHLKSNSDFYGLHQFIGRAGIEIFSVLGVGITLAGVRGKNATPEAEQYMLSTNESEFGWNLHLKFSLLRIGKITFGTKIHYDKIWTKPKNSHLLQAGFFAAY